MEGFREQPAARLARYAADHPDVSIYEDEFGEHYAWKPTPDGGELTHGHTEDALLGKLGG